MNFENKSESIAFPDIALELKQMIDVDQEMRARSEEDDSWDYEVDIFNTKRMKEIVAEIGWPTTSKVGSEGSDDAWLLVQHADHDVSFQEFCLELMKEANESEVKRVHIAYLEDRIRKNKKVGQLYGTQFTQENGQHIPLPIEDEEHVNERRAALGMGPLSEQIEHMYKKYPFREKE